MANVIFMENAEYVLLLADWAQPSGAWCTGSVTEIWAQSEKFTQNKYINDKREVDFCDKHSSEWEHLRLSTSSNQGFHDPPEFVRKEQVAEWHNEHGHQERRYVWNMNLILNIKWQPSTQIKFPSHSSYRKELWIQKQAALQLAWCEPLLKRIWNFGGHSELV